jgi:hypothetical protein
MTRLKLVLFVLIFAFVGIGGKLLINKFSRSNKAWDELIEKSANKTKNDTAESKGTTMGNFVIPPMLGWDKTITKDNHDYSLTYIKYLNNNADVEFEFHYEPTKQGEKPPTVLDIKQRASVMIQGVLRANNHPNLPHVTTVGPQLAKFQNWPAYVILIHRDYSKDPKIIDTDDEKVMVFADKTDMYNIVVDFSNASSTPQSRLLANHVWEKMLKEIHIVQSK